MLSNRTAQTAINRMKKLFAALASLTLTATALAADVTLGWKNGDNPTATPSWHTIVLVGYSPGVNASNYVTSVTVSWPTTNAVVSGLPAGTKCYFAVVHTDLEDISDPSNEVMSKTKINPPTNLTK